MRPQQSTVLLVEDDPLAMRLLAAQLRMAEHSIVEAQSGTAALAAVNERTAVVCLDLGLGDMSGLEVLKRLGERFPDLPVVVVTASDQADDAVSSIQAGAYDYLVKPVEEFRLQSTVQRAMERHRLVRSLRDQSSSDMRLLGNMIGQSSEMQQLADQVQRVLNSDVSVAIFGESGTGKELVAKTLHERGTRSAGPFVALNCAAIPENLLESELFGHEKGAFTGAQNQHLGRFEQANGGTLFLDEIGEMSAATQASLLRTLQEGTIRRVGGTREIHVNTRVICATHRDLAAEVESGRFRSDLYYRLVVYPIQIPALRERSDDIPLLAGYFLKKLARETDSRVQHVDPDALEALVGHSWPGNVRELQNIVHRAVLSCDGTTVTLDHLPKSFATNTAVIPVSPSSASVAPTDLEVPLIPLAELEQRAIRNAMAYTGGSVSKAAKILGIGRATLYRRLSADPSMPTTAVLQN